MINKRQNNQVNRIVNGVNAGQLNLNETTRLVNGQIRVQNLKTQAQSDGVVTFRERARIHTAQYVQSARIFWKQAPLIGSAGPPADPADARNGQRRQLLVLTFGTGRRPQVSQNQAANARLPLHFGMAP